MSIQETGTVKAFGWLFGLAGRNQEIRGDGIVIRAMEEHERERILRASQDFFARDLTIWTNCVKNFPFVFEKVVPLGTPFGGFEPVETILSLLSAGEVRCPIQWQVGPNQGGAASASDVIEYMFRFINGRFQTVELEMHANQIKEGLAQFSSVLRTGPNFEIMDVVVTERLFASKRNVLTPDSPAAYIGRAADTCMCLEYLFNEGSTSEIQFRLALSLAWLLEDSEEKRRSVMADISKAYSLRSKHVHGARWNDRVIKNADKSAVEAADLLLRRALLVKMKARLDDEAWLQLVKGLRLGHIASIDRIEWLKA